MPQLDITNFSSQLFWLALSFVVLYLILARIALPKIARIYSTRQHTVEEKLAQATQAQEKAEKLLVAYESKLNNARAEAHEHYRSVTHTVMTQVAQKQTDFMETLQGRLHLEEQKLYQEALAVRKDIEKASLDVAVALLKKLTAHTYSLKDLAAFREKI